MARRARRSCGAAAGRDRGRGRRDGAGRHLVGARHDQRPHQGDGGCGPDVARPVGTRLDHPRARIRGGGDRRYRGAHPRAHSCRFRAGLDRFSPDPWLSRLDASDAEGHAARQGEESRRASDLRRHHDCGLHAGHGRRVPGLYLATAVARDRARLSLRGDRDMGRHRRRPRPAGAAPSRRCAGSGNPRLPDERRARPALAPLDCHQCLLAGLRRRHLRADGNVRLQHDEPFRAVHPDQLRPAGADPVGGVAAAQQTRSSKSTRMERSVAPAGRGCSASILRSSGWFRCPANGRSTGS